VTLREAKLWASNALATADIDENLVEADLLIEHTLQISKTQLYTEYDRILTSQEVDLLQNIIQRRRKREPVAYITNRCEFYGIDFYIDQRALIPRPETELLVKETIICASHRFCSRDITIADIGTGSGVIAINLALALPRAIIYAIDISNFALQVATINCQRHKVDNRVELIQGNLMEPLLQPVDMVVANLPYVRRHEMEQLSPEIVNFEPRIALDGGEDGLDKVRVLLTQIMGKIHPEGSVLLEVGLGQAKTVASLIKELFPGARVTLSPDLSGINRVVKFNLEEG
jgi:release factor glutamine methyltransferase